MAAFEEVGICPELVNAASDLGWSLPTDIQAEVVPLILGGGDVMAAAETGSGKTGAFCLPVVQIVHERLRSRCLTEAEDTDEVPTACVLSAQDRSSIVAISEDGLQCQARSDREWGGCRGTGCIYKEGKAYFEITVEDEGLCRVGWATRHGSLDIGTDTQSFGYGGTGKKSHGKKFEDYGESFGLHDVIGCWVDLSAKTLGFTKNGRNLGAAYTIPNALVKMPLYPAVCLKNAQVSFNFETSKFPKGYPDGCRPICDVCLLTNPLETSNTKATTDAVSQKLPVALILEPVRDLAQQTKDVMENFARHLTDPAVPVSLLIGGESAAAQIKSIQAGAAIIVGTPGRVADLVQQGKLDISGVKFFVLDEADALLEAGHRDVILSLFRKVGTSGTGMNRLQTLLFSATLHSPHVMRLANELCQNAAFIDLKGMNALPDAVDHALVMADPEEDRTWLQSTPRVWTDRMHDVDPPLAPNSSGAEAWSCAVKCLKPRLLQRLIHGLDIQQALIFCRTNFDCENLEAFMNEIDKGVEESPDKSSVGDKRKRSSRYSCAVLAGARSMDDRRAALDAFKAGTIRYLIATDVAARGIDVSGLPFVINMTLPDKCEDYVHRSGRVGRADTPGLCISIVSSVPEKVWFCRKKGLKPWLNPTKENTSTKKGGHAIWLQEKLLLRDIEERLGTGIVPLQSDMSLPPSLLGSRYGKGGQPKTEADAIALEVAARVEASRDSVKKLAQLEHEAQQTFFKLQSLGWSRS
ncbi:ATP-dependent RNA helicase Ddx1 [Picochlorum sp. SENEW3]|nr:ATP-dependent RNA helicase Ddx1 [Picochlorum sp. SENEW3]WPT15818.1 ATP-dependent RNA helicase Ddx1 [Picochlorum sp. SENEW3]